MDTTQYLNTKQQIAKWLTTDDTLAIFDFVQSGILEAYENAIAISTFSVSNTPFQMAFLDAGTDIIVNFDDVQLSWQEAELVIMGMVACDMGAIENCWQVLS